MGETITIQAETSSEGLKKLAELFGRPGETCEGITSWVNAPEDSEFKTRTKALKELEEQIAKTKSKPIEVKQEVKEVPKKKGFWSKMLGDDEPKKE